MTKHKIKIKKGNQVKIITGKHKGQTGIIKNIITAKNKVVIENINIQTKHTKAKESGEKGTIIQIEGPIDYSNIKVI